MNFCSNKMMVIGGWSAGKISGRFAHSDKVWLYDPKSGEWDLAGEIPLRLRAAGSACVLRF